MRQKHDECGEPSQARKGLNPRTTCCSAVMEIAGCRNAFVHVRSLT